LANSTVGSIIIALPPSLFSLYNNGIEYAKVLPLPVGADTKQFCFSNI